MKRNGDIRLAALAPHARARFEMAGADRIFEIYDTIADAVAILGDRPACLAREVTKMHEEFRRGKLTDIFQTLDERPAKGEITLVIGPAEKGAPGVNIDTAQSLAARVDELMHQAKLDRKEALKLAARERGMSKRDAYRQLLDEKPPATE